MTNVMTQRVTQLMTKMVSHWLTKHDSPVSHDDYKSCD